MTAPQQFVVTAEWIVDSFEAADALSERLCDDLDPETVSVGPHDPDRCAACGQRW